MAGNGIGIPRILVKKNSSRVLTFRGECNMLPTNMGGELMQAYCMKCRTKREMKDAKSITMKNGKPATQGVCPTCGTKMFRIGKS